MLKQRRGAIQGLGIIQCLYVLFFVQSWPKPCLDDENWSKSNESELCYLFTSASMCPVQLITPVFFYRGTSNGKCMTLDTMKDETLHSNKHESLNSPGFFIPDISFLTPSVHKTVMRCFSSCTFFTENRITVFSKDVQLYLISFYLTFIIELTV